jgi:hypothetical protein
MLPDGSGRVRLTGGRASPEVGTGDPDPAWSPDGATLALVWTLPVSFEDFRSQIICSTLSRLPLQSNSQSRRRPTHSPRPVAGGSARRRSRGWRA